MLVGMGKPTHVASSEAQRRGLTDVIGRGNLTTRTNTIARILLLTDVCVLSSGVIGIGAPVSEPLDRD